jgi:DNA polymerase-1
LKLFQNAKFDYKMLKHRCNIELINIFDTYLAERLLTAGLGYECNLAAIYMRYFNTPLDKSVRSSFLTLRELGRASKEQLEYAARDTAVLFEIYPEQMKKLRWQNLTQVADLECRCVAPIAEMELAGMLIDQAKWRAMIEDLAAKRDVAEREMMEFLPGGGVAQGGFFYDEFLLNLNSRDQIISEFKKIGIELEGTAEEHLKKIDHPAARKLLEYRGLEKSVTAFGENVLALVSKQTGRLHATFIQHGAATGRMACSEPNLQQIPSQSDFRSCFIPKPGYKFVNCDFGSCELRILAELSGDETFVTTFNEGGDLHKVAASMVFGVGLEDVTKEQRSIAKVIGFGLCYGAGAATVSNSSGRSQDESRALIESYFSQFPRIKSYLDNSGQFAVNSLYSITPLGRKRFYKKPEDNEQRGQIERQGKNMPIQGGNADGIKAAMVFLRERLRGFDAVMVGVVHDELIVEVREDQAEEVCKLVEQEMIRALELFVKKVSVVADAKVSDYWSK